MDRTHVRSVAVPSRHLCDESADAAGPALWRQGRARQDRRPLGRHGVLHRRRQGLHANGGSRRASRNDGRCRDRQNQPRRKRALTATRPSSPPPEEDEMTATQLRNRRYLEQKLSTHAIAEFFRKHPEFADCEFTFTSRSVTIFAKE